MHEKKYFNLIDSYLDKQCIQSNTMQKSEEVTLISKKQRDGA